MTHASQSSASIQAFSVDALHMLNAGDEMTPGLAPTDALPLGPSHHKVYNFEVANTHTYVADGIRVHNRSVLDFIPVEHLQYVKNLDDTDGVGGPDVAVVQLPNQTHEYEVVARSVDGSERTLVEQTFYDASGQLFYKSFEVGPDNEPIEGTEELVPLRGQQYGQNMLGALTPFLTSVILDEGASTFERVATNTVLGTVLENFGEYIGAGTDRGVRDKGDTYHSEETLETISDAVFNNFGGELIVNGVESTISVVNQLIMAEVFEALHVDGIPGAVYEGFLSAGLNTVLTEGAQFLLNTPVFENILEALPLSDGSLRVIEDFISQHTVFDFGNALPDGSKVGLDHIGLNPISIILSAVLKEILPGAETTEGQLASALASAAFGVWASAAGVFKGAAFLAGPVGLFVGAVVGMLFDSFFEKHPQAWTNVGYDEDLGEFVVLNSWEDDGGNIELSRTIAEQYVETMNGFVEIFQSESNNYGDLANWIFGHYEEAVKNGGPQGRSFQDVQKAVINAYVTDMAELRLNDGQMVAVRALESIEVERRQAEYEEYAHLASILELLEAMDTPEGGSFTLIRGSEMPDNISNGMTFTWSADQSYEERFEEFIIAYVMYALPAIPPYTAPGGESEDDGYYIYRGEAWGFDQLISHIAASMPFFQLAERPTIAPTYPPEEGANDEPTYLEGWIDFLTDYSVYGSGEAEEYSFSFHPERIIGEIADISSFEDALTYLGLQDRVFYSDVQLAGLVTSQLQIADDYHKYLEDVEMISAAMSSDPDSAWTAGWLATLIAIEDTGLNDDFTLQGDEIGNNFFTGNGDDSVLGMSGNDVIKTYGGDDFLDGGTGLDELHGGTGDDIYVIDRWGDLIYEYESEGTDELRLAFSGVDLLNSAGGDLLHIENVTLTGSGKNAKGTDADNVLTGNDGVNQLTGRGGNDTLNGHGGDDQLWGGDGDDIVTGGAGDDMLYGNGDDDTLNGGAGADWIDGGSGIDTVDYSDATGAVGVRLNLYNAQGERIHLNLDNWAMAAGDDLLNIENVIGSDYDDVLVGTGAANIMRGGRGNDTFWLGGGTGADTVYGENGNDTIKANGGDGTLYGGGGNDTIDGGDGDDILIGGSGGDTLIGGAGTDTVSYEDATAGVFMRLQNTVTENFTGDAFGDTFDSLENIIGSNFADNIAGDGGDNVIWGRDGNDKMWGAGGDDELYAGKGNDTLRGQSGNDHLVGAKGNDALYGDADNDTLIGGDGGDVLDGGNGIDTVSFEHASGAVFMRLQNTETQNFTGEAVGDTYISIENIIGSQYADNMAGDSADNVVWGGEGNDKIWGYSGDDTLHGDAGNDTLNGQSGDDHLNGGAGNDILFGGIGVDTLVGGDGIDRAQFTDLSEMVTIDLQYQHNNAGGAAGETYSEIEDLWGSNYNDSLTGDAQGNSIWGGNGHDTINGRGGNDILYGGSGNDRLTGAWGADALLGGDGADWAVYAAWEADLTADLQNNANNAGAAAGDTYSDIENLQGGGGEDSLRGDSGNNLIRGGASADKLFGRLGDDQLWGELGEDKFYFEAGWGNDTVQDFQDDVDTLVFRDINVTSVSNAMLHASQVGNDVVFDFGNGDSLTVLNTTVSALNNDVLVHI